VSREFEQLGGVLLAQTHSMTNLGEARNASKLTSRLERNEEYERVEEIIK
jgi:hypothetical protein